MRVLGYVRVSTEEQAGHGVSLAAQAEKVRAYASLYDLTLVDIVEDGGWSAKSLKRPGVQSVLERIRTGEVQGVVVAKLDRLTRSVADMDLLIRQFFGDRAKHSASLFSVADQIDTRSASGRLVLNVLMSVAQWEREAIGERTSAALRYKMSQGEHIGAVPFGFQREGSQIVELDEELQVVVQIQSHRERGETLRTIVALLNQVGIRTKRGHTWTPMAVKRVLDRAALSVSQ